MKISSQIKLKVCNDISLTYIIFWKAKFLEVKVFIRKNRPFFRLKNRTNLGFGSSETYYLNSREENKLKTLVNNTKNNCQV